MDGGWWQGPWMAWRDCGGCILPATRRRDGFRISLRPWPVGASSPTTKWCRCFPRHSSKPPCRPTRSPEGHLGRGPRALSRNAPLSRLHAARAGTRRRGDAERRGWEKEIGGHPDSIPPAHAWVSRLQRGANAHHLRACSWRASLLLDTALLDRAKGRIHLQSRGGRQDTSVGIRVEGKEPGATAQ